VLSVLDLESAPAIRSVIAITDLLIFLTRACIDWRGAAVQRTRLLLQRENRAAGNTFPRDARPAATGARLVSVHLEL